MFRLGVLATALAVLVLSLGVTAPVGYVPPWWWWLALGVFGATGIGLLFAARVARVLAGLLLLAFAVGAPISLLRTLARSPMEGADLMRWLLVGNAVAMTLLLTWMCIRGIQVLLGRPRGARVVTVRLAGGALAVVAANHLWWAAQVGFEWTAAWSIQISHQGMQLMGFPFWPLWHVALLAVALAMVAGPRRILGHAATALMLLFAGLVPLVIVAAIRTDLLVVAELTIAGMMLVPVYLAWWLRDELRRPRA